MNWFGGSYSVSYQFLILKSPFIQVIFIKSTKHTKNPLFEGLYYNLKGLGPFSKTNFEFFWVSEGLKICQNMYFCYPIGFLHRLFYPYPFQLVFKYLVCSIYHCCQQFGRLDDKITIDVALLRSRNEKGIKSCLSRYLQNQPLIQPSKCLIVAIDCNKLCI